MLPALSGLGAGLRARADGDLLLQRFDIVTGRVVDGT